MRPFIAAACIHRGLLQQALRRPRMEMSMSASGDGLMNHCLPPYQTRRRVAVAFHIVPPGLQADRPRPAIFMLPGQSSQSLQLTRLCELDSSAASNGFIVVYVEQPWRDRFFSWSWYTDWDWAGAPQSNPDVVLDLTGRIHGRRLVGRCRTSISQALPWRGHERHRRLGTP